jgi:integral membrane sensor domain MASE1
VALAAFVVNLPISTSVLPAAATAAGNTLAPLVAATLLAKVGVRREIDRLRDATAIVFVGALLSMSISASVGTGVLVASGAVPADELLRSWAVWWAGDAMGVLVVTPLVLSLVRPWRRPGRPRWKHLEAAVLFALTATVSVVAIGADPHVMFLVIPLLGWRPGGSSNGGRRRLPCSSWWSPRGRPPRGSGRSEPGRCSRRCSHSRRSMRRSPSARSSSPPW